MLTMLVMNPFLLSVRSIRSMKFNNFLSNYLLRRVMYINVALALDFCQVVTFTHREMNDLTSTG